ncbi:hypothetical protein VTN00DRAFT_10101 [Thermoascus crustaceus]|uniref:uncharacterized protein n=1 Tax=Thermoascus crustaceus TaxID=5088 RepID=UPI00374222ED
MASLRILSLFLLVCFLAFVGVQGKQTLALARRDYHPDGPDPDPSPKRFQSNTTRASKSGNTLNVRDLFGLEARQLYECNPGYSECANDSGRCCPTGDRCCGNAYCAEMGDTCCQGGTCPSGWNCCGSDGCYPDGGECCSDGYYCDPGRKCRIFRGEKKCCLPSGCVGEYDSDDNDYHVTTTSYTYTITSEPTATVGDYTYYYTTITWYYYIYFYTTFLYPVPSTTTTTTSITSTRTSTSTTWSYYATDSRDASSFFADRSSTFSFPTPASATSLASLTSSSTSTSTATSTSPPGVNSNFNAGGLSAAVPARGRSMGNSGMWVLTAAVILVPGLFGILI